MTVTASRTFSVEGSTYMIQVSTEPDGEMERVRFDAFLNGIRLRLTKFEQEPVRLMPPINTDELLDVIERMVRRLD